MSEVRGQGPEEKAQEEQPFYTCPHRCVAPAPRRSASGSDLRAWAQYQLELERQQKEVEHAND